MTWKLLPVPTAFKCFDADDHLNFFCKFEEG
jgi:hypothetical protein